MYSKKIALLALVSSLFISGCSDTEKERIEQAEDNLEKIALAPQITKPSEDESVSGIVEVYVDVDTDDMSNYESVTLFIEGKPELVDTEFPYEFSFNSYYWSDNEKISLLAKVETINGNQLRSEVVSVPVAASANNTLTITSPQNNSILRSIGEIAVSWTTLNDAVSYEYQINGGEIISTQESSVQISLSGLGFYQAKVRATNAEGHTGDWSTAIDFTLQQPEITQITTPFNGQSFQNTNQVNLQWAAIESAAYYEYQVDSGEVVHADENQATITIIALGNYSIKVRSIDSLGFNSDWSDSTNFTLTAPNSPTISSTEVAETDDAFELSVAVTNGLATNEIQVATDSSFSGNAIVSTSSSEASLLGAELAAGMYFVRARTNNEFGHESDWSNIQEVTVGLFAHAINMATGWDDYDSPVALVFDEDSFVIAATKGPSGDSSGDDFYVTKIGNDGTKEWGASLLSKAQSPKTIRKADSGYLLSAQGTNWYDAVVLKLNENGQLAWEETIASETDILDGAETYTQEYIYDAVEIEADKYVLLGKYSKRKKTGDWSSELLETKNKITLLDRTGDSANKTEYEFIQPDSGEYNNINDLLLTDDKLYAVGAYKANNNAGDSSDDNFVPTQGSSGAVLFEISKADGSINEENIRTASGLSDRYSSDVAQASNGDIYVSYDKYNVAAASVFHSTAQSTDFVAAYGMKYVKLAADINNNLYMAGSAISDYSSSLLVQFNNASEQARLSLSKYSNNLSIKSIQYDDKYGLLVLATDKGKFVGGDSNDSYTVVFNISASMQYLAPTSLVTDYGQ
jgi:hypothetical protein